MRKHISFAIAATILGFGYGFLGYIQCAYTDADLVRPRVELSSSMSHPHLPAQVLAPIFY